MRVFDCPTYGIKGYKLWCTDLKPLRATINIDVVFNRFEMLQHAAPLKPITTENIDKN